MFDYTRAAIHKIVEDLKKIGIAFKYGAQIFVLAYLVYAIAAGIGYLVVNVVLMAVVVAYLAFNIITAKKRDKTFKKIKRRVKHSYKIARLFIKAFMLGITLYGVYTTATHVSALSIIFTTLMIIFWVLQTLFELIVLVFESKKELLIAGLEKDFESVRKPVTVARDFFRKMAGKEVEVEKEPSKAVEILEKQIEKDKEEKRRKKEEREFYEEIE